MRDCLCEFSKYVSHIGMHASGVPDQLKACAALSRIALGEHNPIWGRVELHQ